MSLTSIVLLIQGDIVSVSSICGIGIGAIVVLSILSGIVGCALLVAGSWSGAVGGTRVGVISVIRIVRIVVRAAMRPIVGSSVVMVVAIPATIIVIARRSGFEFLVLLLDVGNQVFAKFFGLGNHIGIRSCDMKEHVFVAFTIGGSLQVA